MSNLQHEAFLNRQKGPSAMSDGLIPTPGLAKDQPKDTDAKVDYIAPAPTPAPESDAPDDVGSFTKTELKSYLEDSGIDFPSDATKAELLDLV